MIVIGGAIFVGGATSLVTTSAHTIPENGITVNCDKGTVVVDVTGWSGDVEIVGPAPSTNATDKAPTVDGNGDGSATFTIAEIGGDGNYTAGRQGFPTDPVPKAFTVDCPAPPPSVQTTCGGSVTFTGVPQGWYAVVEPGDHLFTFTSSSGTFPLAPGDYTYEFRDALANDETGGSFTIDDCTTTLTTELSMSTISTGGMVSDTATISGATSDAGGTITYNVYTNNECSGDAFADATPTINTVVDGVAPASKSITFNSAGTYYWQAVYSGDTANDGATSDCSAEVLTVQAPSVSIAKTTLTPKVDAGTTISYTLTISNGGPGTAVNVQVTDTVPTSAGLSWSITGGTNGGNTDCTLSAGKVTCTFASLAPTTASTAPTVTISSPTTTATCGFVNNSATVTSANDGGNTSGPIQVEVDCPASGVQGISTGTGSGVQGISTSTPSTGSAGAATGITAGGFLVLGGLTLILLGLLAKAPAPRRTRS